MWFLWYMGGNMTECAAITPHGRPASSAGGAMAQLCRAQGLGKCVDLSWRDTAGLDWVHPDPCLAGPDTCWYKPGLGLVSSQACPKGETLAPLSNSCACDKSLVAGLTDYLRYSGGR